MPDDPRTSSTRHANPGPIQPNLSADAEGDLLGVQELNLATSSVENRPSDSSMSAEDDDTAHSSTEPQPEGGVHQVGDQSSTFERFIQNTRKRLAPSPLDPTGEAPIYNVEGTADEDDDLYEGQVRPLIYGSLHKLSRSGKWQKRFFETDGESLSYFKSEKRVKLLATLDLFKVGVITISDDDPTGRTFTIQVADRPYSLRAESKATCKDWVITLNRIKEARMQVGGVKLVTPKFHPPPPDLLDGATGHEIAPRVVLVANRQRTRAVDSENPQAWEQIVHTQNAYPDGSNAWVGPNHTTQRSVLGKWKKRHSALAGLRRRLLKWARSIRKKATCATSEDDVVALDRHTHPPGHDDAPSDTDGEVSRRIEPRDDNSSWSEVDETKTEISRPVWDDDARQLA